MMMLGFFLYGVVFLLPVFLARMYHYNATQVGMFFIPGSILTMLMMPMIGKLMQSGKNPKVLIAIGFFSIEVCLALMTYLSPLSPKGEILRMLYVRGFALAFLFVPINSAILSQYQGSSLGQVSGLMNLFRQIGGSIGIALVATLLNVRSHQNYLDVAAKVTQLHVQARATYAGAVQSMATKMPVDVGFANPAETGYKILYFKVQNQVFMMTFLQLVYIMMLIMAVSAIPIIRLKLKKGPVKLVDAH